MDLTQLWQTILEQLQQEIPRASYDTWIRDTQALSLEDSQLRVLTRNSYAQDWLNNKMTEDVNARLAALGVEAQVSFVLEDEEPDPEEEESEGERFFTATPVGGTEYLQEVNPGRAVVFQGYALRLLEHGDITPKAMSVWVGMRQAVYQKWSKGRGTVKNIPYWEAQRFANMSRNSFFRETSGKDVFADGLVKVVPTPADQPIHDRRFDNANRYEVLMSPHLTRRDGAVLQELLHREVCLAASNAEAVQIARNTLQQLIDRDPGQYLEEVQPKVVSDAQKRSVVEIVRQTLDLHGELPEDLRQLANKVMDRILLSFGLVVIPHYFLQKTAKRFHLTHPQMWAIIMLRDRCWYDHETRTQKNFALLSGGIMQLGQWVGVDRRTIQRWFKDPDFATFVQVSDAETLNLSTEWVRQRTVFLVRLDEPLEECDIVGTDVRQSGHRPATKWAPTLDKVGNGVRQNGHTLNNFIKPQVNPNNPQESPPAPAVAAAPAGRVGNGGFWDLDFLLEINQVSPGSRAHLFKTNKEWGRDLKALSQGFVALLLFAFSPQGQSWVKSPAGFALKRLNANLHPGAGAEFEHLARLAPYRLQGLFDADLAGLELDDSFEADLYRVNFAGLLPEHKQDLYKRLFGFESLQKLVTKEVPDGTQQSVR